MLELHSGQRLLDQMFDVCGRTDFHQLRHFLDDYIFFGLGGYGKIHARVREILFVVDGGSVDRTLHRLQGQRHEVCGDNRLQQRAQFFVELGEDRTELVMCIEWQIARAELRAKK